MARSDFILGRTANRKAFEVAKQGGKSFVVTAYGFKGHLRYADATWIGPRNKREAGKPTERPLSRYPWYVKDISDKKVARIRIIVTPKKDYKP